MVVYFQLLDTVPLYCCCKMWRLCCTAIITTGSQYSVVPPLFQSVYHQVHIFCPQKRFILQQLQCQMWQPNPLNHVCSLVILRSGVLSLFSSFLKPSRLFTSTIVPFKLPYQNTTNLLNQNLNRCAQQPKKKMSFFTGDLSISNMKAKISYHIHLIFAR